MAEQVLVTDTYLTGIADAIRDTTGDTATMKPSAMVTAAEGIATEVSTQTTQIASNADLIAQIKTALEGKAGGSGSDASVETCTVVIDCSIAYISFSIATTFSDGIIGADIRGMQFYGSGYKGVVTIENVICGSPVAIITSGLAIPGWTLSNAEEAGGTNYCSGFKITAGAGETATITQYDND